ncbi:MAG: RSP_2648 family PIN domain-containing protein [Planktomarina sp.]
MRLVLDACVLYPNVMRSALLAVASTGAFAPIWSPRLLEEWRRAAARRSAIEGAAAESEIALLGLHWPNARRADVQNTDRYWLPDDNDVHVLALAVDSSADGIVTMNAKDFPRHILAEEGISRLDPDDFLTQCFTANESDIHAALTQVVHRAQIDMPDISGRALFKKARLPRLGKAFDAFEV